MANSIKQKMTKLMKGKQVADDSSFVNFRQVVDDSSSVNFAYTNEFSGMATKLGFLDGKFGCWIVDTRASVHMCSLIYSYCLSHLVK